MGSPAGDDAVGSSSGADGADASSQAEVRRAWDEIAGFWDERMVAGATWQRAVIQPAVERLLELRSGERALDVACGNGEFARRMAGIGATVVAVDFSAPMLDRARAHGGPVDYVLADATDEAELLSLGGRGSFDAAICNMAMMDMAELEPMARALAGLLRPDGRFVFSTLHPAFGGSSVRRLVEQWDDAGGIRSAHAVRVSNYIRPSTGEGVALDGQPRPHRWFHRPLKDLVGPFLRRGFVLDAVDEPVLSADAVDPGSPAAVFVEVPPIFVARMRPGRHPR